MKPDLIIRQLQSSYPYQTTWEAMKCFTLQRDSNTIDELWLLEHEPVYTQGLAGKAEHLLNPQQIPVVQSDRGGQITYHGPGQLMLYSLFDIDRLGLSIRHFVCQLEQVIIQYLASHSIKAEARRDAPGVYIHGAKIASIGLRVKKGRAYHGIAFNIDMDLSPFTGINPCGFAHLKMTQLTEFEKNASIFHTRRAIIPTLCKIFSYNAPQSTTDKPELLKNAEH